MVKAKKSAAAAPEKKKKDEEKIKPTIEKDDSEKKKKHRRVGIKSKFTTPIKRLCKTLKIFQVNRDAVHILDDAVQKYIAGLTKHMSSMLANSNKKLTQKTAKLAYIGYMEALGVSDTITKGGLKRADAALQHLADSLGGDAAAPKKTAPKKTAAASKKW